MIRVVIHYARSVSSETMQALAQERLHVRTNDPPFRPAPIQMRTSLVWCPPEQKHAYGDSLRELWAWGQPFINLEADVAPWPGALTQLWNCPQPWCALPLVVHNCVNERNLGCVKFSAAFIKRYPNIWKNYPRNDIFDWRSLDGWLYQQVHPALAHRHPPPALHMNPAHTNEGVPHASEIELDPEHPEHAEESGHEGPASRAGREGADDRQAVRRR